MDDTNLKNESPELLEQPGPESGVAPDYNIYNTVSENEFQDAGTDITRPGIRPETLRQSRIRRVTAEEAEKLCKCGKSGIWIPYLTLQGHSVLDGGEPYGRLRKDTDAPNKYHQERDTAAYIYIPSGFAVKFCSSHLEFLIVVEGEFKALSLFEDDYPAIAFPGFFGYSSDRTVNTRELLPDLKELLDVYTPGKVYFVGDGDTSLNVKFSIAALNLAKLLDPIPLYLPRLPLNGPKGVDDVKEALLHG